MSIWIATFFLVVSAAIAQDPESAPNMSPRETASLRKLSLQENKAEVVTRIEAIFSQMAASGFENVSKGYFSELLVMRSKICKTEPQSCDNVNQAWQNFLCGVPSDTEPDRWLAHYLGHLRDEGQALVFIKNSLNRIKVRNRDCATGFIVASGATFHKRGWKKAEAALTKEINAAFATQTADMIKVLARISEYEMDRGILPTFLRSSVHSAWKRYVFSGNKITDSDSIFSGMNFLLYNRGDTQTVIEFFKALGPKTIRELPLGGAQWTASYCSAVIMTARYDECERVLGEYARSSNPTIKLIYNLQLMSLDASQLGLERLKATLSQMPGFNLERCHANNAEAMWSLYYAAKYYRAIKDLAKAEACIKQFAAGAFSAPKWLLIIKDIEFAKIRRQQGNFVDSNAQIASGQRKLKQVVGERSFLDVLLSLETLMNQGASGSVKEFSLTEERLLNLTEELKLPAYRRIVKLARTILIEKKSPEIPKDEPILLSELEDLRVLRRTQ